MAIGLSLLFGIRLPLNFNAPYKATQHHRFLAALAHDAVALPARLSLYPARRQPPRPAGATSTDAHHAARRPLARRGLDVRRLGRPARRSICCINHAWHMALRSPALPRPAIVVAVLLTFLAVVVAWVFFRADSMPSALYVLSKMADPSRSPSAAGKSLKLSSRSTPRWPGSRRIRRRSWATITATGPSARSSARGGCGRRSSMPPRRAGLRDSRNPAAQRIHLFQVLRCRRFAMFKQGADKQTR